MVHWRHVPRGHVLGLGEWGVRGKKGFRRLGRVEVEGWQ